MALDNLISVTFTEAELKELDDALAVLEKVLSGKVINLTKEQRMQYGRVKYDMEVWVNKTSSYIYNNAPLVPAYVNAAELKVDMAAHAILNPRIDRLSGILQGMVDTNSLLGADIYNSCMSFYRSVKVAAGNAPGAAPIYNDLKQQFPGAPAKKTTPTK
ncbi:hypothetical protein [uncultured Acetobacteroides sp.]|uniref:hypothetical protein n=1 Tax=uncultured Acetobacteroides sp. TaxID=1760811 RepID=UPI0029F51703|nr:hypothetical protein [uncultured Acetobacteroides sp.]